MFEINFHFARWRIGRTVEERVRKRYLSLPVSALLQFLSPLFHNFSSSLSLSLCLVSSERGNRRGFFAIRYVRGKQKRKRNERKREGGNSGEKKRERGGEMDEQASDEKKKKEKRTDENDSR